MRVVFDTNTVVSALLFEEGRLAWLRDHWRQENVHALISKDTANELIRVLAYPKFSLERAEIEALLAEYIPSTEAVEVNTPRGTPRCSDRHDQKFVDLAISGSAEALVTGDKALLEMKLEIDIETPATYRSRFDTGV